MTVAPPFNLCMLLAKDLGGKNVGGHILDPLSGEAPKP